MYAEIQLNTNTLETRVMHCAEPLRFHDGFTSEDAASGWTQAYAMAAAGLSPAELEVRCKDVVCDHRRFWMEIVERHRDCSIVSAGMHYSSAPLGVGCGFGGRAFEVSWHDTSRPPLICNLSAQGEVPQWLRPDLPDNARIVELGYLLDRRPVLSRSMVKRRLKRAGLRPAQANAVVRAYGESIHRSHHDHWPSAVLHEVVKHGKRHADRWFPLDVAIGGSNSHGDVG